MINQKTIFPISLESPWITLNGCNLDSIVICRAPFPLSLSHFAIEAHFRKISPELIFVIRLTSCVSFIPSHYVNRYFRSLGFSKNDNIFPIIITPYASISLSFSAVTRCTIVQDNRTEQCCTNHCTIKIIEYNSQRTKTKGNSSGMTHPSTSSVVLSRCRRRRRSAICRHSGGWGNMVGTCTNRTPALTPIEQTIPGRRRRGGNPDKCFSGFELQGCHIIFTMSVGGTESAALQHRARIDEWHHQESLLSLGVFVVAVVVVPVWLLKANVFAWASSSKVTTTTPCSEQRVGSVTTNV